MGFTREIIWRKCDMNGAICFYYCTCVLIVCLYLFIIGSFWDLIKQSKPNSVSSVATMAQSAGS